VAKKYTTQLSHNNMITHDDKCLHEKKPICFVIRNSIVLTKNGIDNYEFITNFSVKFMKFDN